MKNRVLRLAALMSIAGCSALLATTELRTPLSVVRDFGPFHYRLDPVDDGCWSFDIFSSLYYRRADRGFGTPENSRHATRKTVSLPELFFGKAAFVGTDSFAMSSTGPCPVVPNNPFVSFAQLNPLFHYTEKGLVSGAHLERRFGCEQQWRVGAKAALPFKMIRVERDATCKPCEEGIENVARTLEEQVDKGVTTSAVRKVYIYRLDFLTALRQLSLPANSLVRYTPPLTIANVNVGGNGATTGTQVLPIVSAIRSVDGTINGILSSIGLPTGESNMAQNVPQTTPFVNADGSGGANGDRLQFNIGTDYSAGLGNNCEAQRQLFVIPNSNGLGALRANNGGSADQVRQQVEFILNSLVGTSNSSASGFFASKGINFLETQRVNGIGDFDTDLYVGYDWSDCLNFDVALGVRWPTGKKQKDAGQALFQPTGNNGHYELKGQLEMGWTPCNWFGLHTEFSYSHAFRRTEKKAAAFKGATVKNIGSSVDARVSYGYFVFHVDGTVFHPENCDLGMVLSYELYSKRSDKVAFLEARANDLNGVSQELDATILENNTKALTHKIRGEFFHRWDYCELFIGASRVLAGRNAFKETEAHIGMGISF